MASNNRRANHKSCRDRRFNTKLYKNNGKTPSNAPRSTKIARIRYEKEGVIMGLGKGHKMWGWSDFPTFHWKPVFLKGAK